MIRWLLSRGIFGFPAAAGSEIIQAAAGYIIARHHYERMWLANHVQHAYERAKLGITEPRDD